MPAALATRGVAALVLAGLLLFGSHAGGVFADEPDEELPPGTITNLRWDSQPPYDFYVTWDPPSGPAPADYDVKYRHLGKCVDRVCEIQETSIPGDATSAIIDGFKLPLHKEYSFWMRARYGSGPRIWYGPWLGIVGYRGWNLLFIVETTTRGQLA